MHVRIFFTGNLAFHFTSSIEYLIPMYRCHYLTCKKCLERLSHWQVSMRYIDNSFTFSTHNAAHKTNAIYKDKIQNTLILLYNTMQSVKTCYAHPQDRPSLTKQIQRETFLLWASLYVAYIVIVCCVRDRPIDQSVRRSIIANASSKA